MQGLAHGSKEDLTLTKLMFYEVPKKCQTREIEALLQGVV